MAKRYIFVILTYIAMQYSSLLFVPLLVKNFSIDPVKVFSYWSVFSFLVSLIIILFLMKPDMKLEDTRDDAANIRQIILWSIIGIFMAYLAQAVAVLIEINLFGIAPGSENTEVIIDITRAAPIFFIIPAIIAPILEEIIFRKIVFGSLYKRMNFFFAALLSAFVFGIIHGEPQHILIYASMGFVFAFLYVKTKRIIVPIIVHMGMNSLVIIAQLSVSPEDIEQMQKILNEMVILIGG